MMMASKYLYDEGVDEEVFNDEWADSADMDVKDLNELERNFLDAIDWNLFVKREEFMKVLNGMEQCIAAKKGADRNFYTYTDLMVLLTSARLQQSLRQVLLEFCKVMAVCSVAYVAGSAVVLSSVLTLNYVKHNIPAKTSLQPIALPLVSLLSDSEDQEFCVSCDTGLTDHTVTNVDIECQIDQRTLDCTRKEEITVAESHLGFASQSRLPGFLTLVLIKDTLFQFMIGVHEKLKEESHITVDQDSDFGFESDIGALNQLTCTCGCCSPNVKEHCQNVSASMTGKWWSTQFHTYKWNRHDRMERTGGHRGPSHMAMAASPERYKSVQDFGLCGQFKCCCPRSYGSEEKKWSQPVDYPFHDISLGFSTAASKQTLVSG